MFYLPVATDAQFNLCKYLWTCSGCDFLTDVKVQWKERCRGALVLIHRTITFQVIKTIQDSAGRYVVTQRNLLSHTLNLVSVYGPNEDKPTFLEDLFLSLSALRGSFIIGGDFNCTLNPAKDRSTGHDTSEMTTRELLKQYIVDANLEEVWREHNPDRVEFSCHSSIWISFSHWLFPCFKGTFN